MAAYIRSPPCPEPTAGLATASASTQSSFIIVVDRKLSLRYRFILRNFSHAELAWFMKLDIAIQKSWSVVISRDKDIAVVVVFLKLQV